MNHLQSSSQDVSIKGTKIIFFLSNIITGQILIPIIKTSVNFYKGDANKVDNMNRTIQAFFSEIYFKYKYVYTTIY